jgi:hypothetical protein
MERSAVPVGVAAFMPKGMVRPVGKNRGDGAITAPREGAREETPGKAGKNYRRPEQIGSGWPYGDYRIAMMPCQYDTSLRKPLAPSAASSASTPRLPGTVMKPRL